LAVASVTSATTTGCASEKLEVLGFLSSSSLSRLRLRRFSRLLSSRLLSSRLLSWLLLLFLSRLLLRALRSSFSPSFFSLSSFLSRRSSRRSRSRSRSRSRRSPSRRSLSRRSLSSRLSRSSRRSLSSRLSRSFRSRLLLRRPRLRSRLRCFSVFQLFSGSVFSGSPTSSPFWIFVSNHDMMSAGRLAPCKCLDIWSMSFFLSGRLARAVVKSSIVLWSRSYLLANFSTSTSRLDFPSCNSRIFVKSRKVGTGAAFNASHTLLTSSSKVLGRDFSTSFRFEVIPSFKEK